MRPPRVFISYCRKRGEIEDNDLVTRVGQLARWLQADGVAVWDDQHNPCVGEDFGTWMERGLDHVDVALVVCTPDYHSRWRTGPSSGAGYESKLLRVGALRGDAIPAVPLLIRGFGARPDIPKALEQPFVELAAAGETALRHGDPGYVALLQQVCRIPAREGTAKLKATDRLREPEARRVGVVQAALALAERIETADWTTGAKVDALAQRLKAHVPDGHAAVAAALPAAADRERALRGLLLLIAERMADDPWGALEADLFPKARGRESAANGTPDMLYARVDRRGGSYAVSETWARFRGPPFFGARRKPGTLLRPPRPDEPFVGPQGVAAALLLEAGSFGGLAKPEALCVALVVDADEEVSPELVRGRPANGQPTLVRRHRSVSLWPVHDGAVALGMSPEPVHGHDHVSNVVIAADPASHDHWYDAREGKVAVLVGPAVNRRDAVDTHTNLLTLLLPDLCHGERLLAAGAARPAADVLAATRPKSADDAHCLAIWTDAELHPYDNLARTL